MSDLPNLLRRKLEDELSMVDSHTEAAIREVWKTIGPQPTCPFVSDVMREVQMICANGLTERERVAVDLLSATVLPFKETLSVGLVQELTAVTETSFPLDKFVALVEHTPGVYQRRQAETRNFDQSSYEHYLALIKSSAANVPRRSIRRMRLVLDELLLQKETEKVSLWKKIASWTWYGLAKPTMKWAFGIVATVLAVLGVDFFWSWAVMLFNWLV